MTSGKAKCFNLVLPITDAQSIKAVTVTSNQQLLHFDLQSSIDNVHLTFKDRKIHCYPSLSRHGQSCMLWVLHNHWVNMLFVLIFHNKLFYPRARSAIPCFIEQRVPLFKIARYLECRASQDRPIREPLTRR